MAMSQEKRPVEVRRHLDPRRRTEKTMSKLHHSLEELSRPVLNRILPSWVSVMPNFSRFVPRNTRKQERR
jgi:hypothetical protein